MSKQAFPEAYIGSGPRFGSTRGIERWNMERSASIARREKDLMNLHDAEKPERRITYQARASNHFGLGLLYAWEGRAELARKQIADCLATTCEYFQYYWPNIDPASCCGLAQTGAIAAAMLDQHDLARTLFTHASHFSAGLITGQEAVPLDRTGFSMYIIDYALIQAYSQFRLGQLSGFRAMLYPVGFPEAKRNPPVLRTGSVGDILQTIDIAIEVGRAKGENTGLIWSHIKFQIPVLRTLYAYAQAPSDASAEPARKALVKYYEMIRDLADFPVIYACVLDLQQAYPQVYGEVTPSVFA